MVTMVNHLRVQGLVAAGIGAGGAALGVGLTLIAGLFRRKGRMTKGKKSQQSSASTPRSQAEGVQFKAFGSPTGMEDMTASPRFIPKRSSPVSTIL